MSSMTISTADTTKTKASSTPQAICPLDDIVPETGVCALVAGKQIAIFRTRDDELYAIDNFDPFSQTNILSRGLIGGTTRVVDDEPQEVLYVASPMYKQRFDLATGQCLDDDDVQIGSYAVSLKGNEVWVEI